MNLLRFTVVALAFILCACGNRHLTIITSGPSDIVTSSNAVFELDTTFSGPDRVGEFTYHLNGVFGPPQQSGTVTFSGLTTGTYTFTAEFFSNRSNAKALPAVRQWTVITGTPSGTPELAFAPDVGVMGNRVVATAVQPDGKILIAGFFTAVNSQTRNFIARLEATGALEATTTFNPGIGADNFVSCVAVQTDGKILLGGGFSNVAGQPRSRIARLHPTGAVEDVLSFNPGTGVNSTGTVNCLAVEADGAILLGGTFTSVNGQPRGRIARLNSDGSVQITAFFNPGSGVAGSVSSLAVQPNGNILVGGTFTSVGGQPRYGIARLLANGNVESTTTFLPGTTINDFVTCIAVRPDKTILLGGFFVRADGLTYDHLICLRSEGTRETTDRFNPGTGPAFSPFASSVQSIALEAGGKILIGGYFESYDGQPRKRIARLHASGRLANIATFDIGPGVAGAGTEGVGVRSLAVQKDGQILLGGDFTMVSGQTHHRIARLLNDPAPQSLAPTSSARVEWLRGGAAPEIEQVTFELSTDGGANWTSLGTGTRITGITFDVGWQRTGLALPAQGTLRARGRTIGGNGGGSSGLIEQIATYNLAAPPSPPASPLPPIEIWRQQTFGADAGTPAIAGNDADPDSDSFKNLMEYAFGSDPLAASSVPQAGGYPEGGFAYFIYQRPVTTIDIGYGLEKSDTLGSWTDAVFTEEILGEDELTRTMRVKIPFDLSNPSQPRGFLRAKVTLLP